ncbi:MAG: hypothetical protein ACI4AM_02160 [Muribaculaceae bacterium]
MSTPTNESNDKYKDFLVETPQEEPEEKKPSCLQRFLWAIVSTAIAMGIKFLLSEL